MKTLRVNKHLIFTMLLLGYFFAVFFRISTSVVLPDLQEQWGLSASLIGFISSMYFYTCGAIQPVCGILNDRMGPPRVVGIGIVITSAGSLIFGLATNSAMLIIGRLLMGIGLAPMLSGLVVFQGTRYPASQYTFLSGLSLMTGNIGAVCSVAPLTAALNIWGRQPVFVALALGILVVAAVLLIASYLDKSPELFTPPCTTSFKQQFKDAVSAIRKSRDLRRVIVVWTAFTAGILSLQGLWAVSWFCVAYGMENQSASLTATMIGVGVMVGNFVGGQFGRNPHTQHRLVALYILADAVLWGLVVLCFALRVPIWITTLAVTLLGVICGMGPVQCISSLNVLSPPGLSGSIMGMGNAVLIFGAVVYQWGSSVLIELFAPLAGPENLNLAYVLSFLTVTLSMIIPCACGLRLKPFTKQESSRC